MGRCRRTARRWSRRSSSGRPARNRDRRHRVIVRGLLVGLVAALVAGIGFGAWWFIAAGDTPSTSKVQRQSATPAATPTTPSPPPRPTTAAMPPLALTASGPGRLTPGSRRSVLPGPILNADEHNHRLTIIDPRGRTMWQFPRPGDLAPGQTHDPRHQPCPGTLPGVRSCPASPTSTKANEISPNRYLTIDHASPGQLLTFDRAGHVLWRYAPTGRQAMNMPSLAPPLPNGDFLADGESVSWGQ